MDANGLVLMPGRGPVWKMAPGRSSTLKLRNGETDESVMLFEEVAPVGTVTRCTSITTATRSPMS